MKTIYKIAAVATIFTAPAFAVFGLGDIVWDPTTMAEVVKDLNEAIKLNGLITTGMNFFKQKQSWQSQARNITNTVVGNQSGLMGGWGGAVNQGINVGGVYRGATVPIPTTLPYNGNRSLQSSVAQIEALDGAAMNALTVHGQSTTSLLNLANTVLKFKSVLFDTSGGTNSQVQQLNLLNAGQSHQMDLDQTRAQMEQAQLQITTAASMRQRNQDAEHLQYLAAEDQWANTSGYALTSPKHGWTPGQ